MKIIKPQEKIKLSKRKNSTKCVFLCFFVCVFFFRVGVERVRKKPEVRKCSLLLVKLRTEDIKLIQ